MKKASGWLLALVAVAATVALIFHWLPDEPADELRLTPPAAEPPPPPPVAVEPRIEYPVPAPPSAGASALPTLENSDALAQQMLRALIGTNAFSDLVRLPDLVRRVVATIDNLPRRKVALRLMPLKSVPGRFLVSGDSGNVSVHSGNSARYAPYVRLAEAVNATKLAALYVQLYPLFQQAYVELGYPQGYFNDRLVFVIDHLLAAPDPKELPRLVQPHVMYEFAAPELESLSAGQKIMIRMGSDNAARVKAKLRAIRAELIDLDPGRLQQ